MGQALTRAEAEILAASQTKDIAAPLVIGDAAPATERLDRNEFRMIVGQLQGLLAPRKRLNPGNRADPHARAEREWRKREQRSTLFGADLFADPAWDLLLILFAFADRANSLKVRQLQEMAKVPLTTAIRWLAVLDHRGLVWRETDTNDRRVTNVGLTQKGTERMLAYFAE
jgi:hypothetical protein